MDAASEMFSLPHLTLFYPTVKLSLAQKFYEPNQLRYLNLFETINWNIKFSIETNFNSYKSFKFIQHILYFKRLKLLHTIHSS